LLSSMLLISVGARDWLSDVARHALADAQVAQAGAV
jgi:hypothetical protein